MLLTEAIVRDSMGRVDSRKIDQWKRETKDEPRRLSGVQRSHLMTGMLAATGSRSEAAQAFERVIGGNDLTGINYLARGTNAGRSVCRVTLRDASGRVEGYGTGFLTAERLLMTNNHVIGSDTEGARALAEFDYEQDAQGRDKESVTFELDPAYCFVTDAGLDFTLIGVKPAPVSGHTPLSSYGWLPLKPDPGKSFIGEYLTIIQHPSGERKQVCVRENKLLKYEDNVVWYQTDTAAGSSGSPVFNGFWDVVGLHHSGVPETNANGDWMTTDGKVWDKQTMDETRIHWIANEGIRASRISEFLRLNHPSVAALLQTGTPTESAPAAAPAPDTGPVYWREGKLFVSLPVSTLAALEKKPAPPPPAVIAGPAPAAIEKVEIDTSNYDERPGYQAGFLGAKKELQVPLPALTAATKKVVAPLLGKPDEYLLNYYNYSCALHATRRLALFSCVNINGGQLRDTGKREGDVWIKDKRIADKYQLLQWFYSGKTEEVERNTPWDRGHLVRRLDATWGATEPIAKRNGDDTFHFTNCTPQHFAFNEGVSKQAAADYNTKVSRLWAGLEDYVLQLVDNEQALACVFNGPVFGAKDPEFNKIQIPLQFWKILAISRGGKLSAAGFVLSQKLFVEQDTKKEVAFRPLTAVELKAAQLPISEIGKLAKLDFGPLVKADALRGADEALGVRSLESFSEIRI